MKTRLARLQRPARDALKYSNLGGDAVAIADLRPLIVAGQLDQHCPIDIAGNLARVLDPDASVARAMKCWHRHPNIAEHRPDIRSAAQPQQLASHAGAHALLFEAHPGAAKP
jgi:hypothetical protein